MSKKKVESLLKGVAITGATVGGASILGDANLAYAAEASEEETVSSAAAEITVEVSHEETQAAAAEASHEESTQEESKEETITETVEENVTETTEATNDVPSDGGDATNEDTVAEGETAEDTTAADAVAAATETDEATIELQDASEVAEEAASTSLSTEDSTIDSTSDSAEDSLSAEDSSIDSTSTSAEDSLTSEEDDIASTSAKASEEAASESASLSTAMSEAEAAYDSASTSFSEAGLEDEYLEDLIRQIEEAKEALEAAQAEAIANGQNLNHDSNSNNYYGYGDTLANLLIQYAFYQEGYVGEILYSEWDSSNYNTNSVKVTYVDASGETKYAYFDYVTVDSDGNALVSGFYDSPSYGSQHDNPNVVAGIMVVKKTVQYTDGNGNILTWDYTTETAEDGTETSVCHYYVNGAEVADNVTVTLNDDDTFTLSWSNTSEANVVTVVEENLGNYESYIYDDISSNTVYHSLGMYSTAATANNWNNTLTNYYRNSSDTTVGVLTTDEETGVSTIWTNILLLHCKYC